MSTECPRNQNNPAKIKLEQFENLFLAGNQAEK